MLIPGDVQYAANSSNTANNANSVSITPAANQRAYVTQITCTQGGATAGLATTLTVNNITPGGQSWAMHVPVGADALPDRLVLNFNPPLRGSAVGTAISASQTAGGAGQTTAGITIVGFVVNEPTSI